MPALDFFRLSRLFCAMQAFLSTVLRIRKLPFLPGYTNVHLELHIHLGYIPLQERCELCSVRFLSIKGDLERSCRKWPLESWAFNLSCACSQIRLHAMDPGTFQVLLQREGTMLNYGHNLLSNKVKNVKSWDCKLCGIFRGQKSISVELEWNTCLI